MSYLGETIPLILQGGGAYNVPPTRAPENSKILLLVAAAAGMWIALGIGGKGRNTW